MEEGVNRMMMEVLNWGDSAREKGVLTTTTTTTATPAPPKRTFQSSFVPEIVSRFLRCAWEVLVALGMTIGNWLGEEISPQSAPPYKLSRSGLFLERSSSPGVVGEILESFPFHVCVCVCVCVGFLLWFGFPPPFVCTSKDPGGGGDRRVLLGSSYQAISIIVHTMKMIPIDVTKPRLVQLLGDFIWENPPFWVLVWLQTEINMKEFRYWVGAGTLNCVWVSVLLSQTFSDFDDSLSYLFSSLSYRIL